MHPFKLKAMAAAVLLVASLSAQAALVTTPFTGTIDFAAPDNPFGVSLGDTVFASTTYDDAQVAPTGSTILHIDSDASFALSVTVGTTSITADQDTGYGSGFPRLHFLDGQLTGVDMIARFDQGTVIMEFGTLFPGYTKFYIDNLFTGPVVEGVFILPPAPVPIPPALFLFGTALAGLALLGRRLPLPGLRPAEPQPA